MLIICNPIGGFPEPQIMDDSKELLTRKAYSKMVIKNNNQNKNNSLKWKSVLFYSLKLGNF